MKRLDAWLVELGLVPSRTKAQRLIEAGEVEIEQNQKWKVITQGSFDCSRLSHSQVRVNPQASELKYVSRGGLKLEAAIDHVGLNVKGYRILDVGISTGGFADCLLHRGASEVVGIDVGHDQLAERLRRDKRIRHFEGVNVREILQADRIALKKELVRGFDLCVVDVSFISLVYVLPVLKELLRPGTRLLALLKPQFELGADALDKNGIVRDSESIPRAIEKISRAMFDNGFATPVAFPSEVKGQDGNQEYFLFTQRSQNF